MFGAFPELELGDSSRAEIHQQSPLKLQVLPKLELTTFTVVEIQQQSIDPKLELSDSSSG